MNENDIRRYARLMSELEITGMEINESLGSLRLEKSPHINYSRISLGAENGYAGTGYQGLNDIGKIINKNTKEAAENVPVAGTNDKYENAPEVSLEEREKEGPKTKKNTAGGKETYIKSVTSPAVGIYYSSPAENADEFVKTGSRVKKGEVLCIIEVMKLMNEITAEEDGIIEKICVKNGQVVEFGTELFRIAVDVA